jgi:hypothetical protein
MNKIRGILHEWRTRRRYRRRVHLHHVRDLGREDAELDDRAVLHHEDPGPRWLGADAGDAGRRFWNRRERRGRPVGKRDVNLTGLRTEYKVLQRRLAEMIKVIEETAGKLAEKRRRWFGEGVTRGRLIAVRLVVFVIEAIANYVTFVTLPLPEGLRIAFAALFAALIAFPAEWAGILLTDAVLNWDTREHGKGEKVHHTAIIVAGTVAAIVAVGLTIALGLGREANFVALREKYPDGVFAAVDPTALAIALILGALAGVIGLFFVACKYQAGAIRAEWATKLALTKRERKQAENRLDRLEVEIAKAERRFDWQVERHGAKGLAERKEGMAARAQYDRAYANRQRELGRKPEVPGPEPEPDPRPYYEPAPPVHQVLPHQVEEPDEAAPTNGVDGDKDQEELKARIQRLEDTNNNK